MKKILFLLLALPTFALANKTLAIQNTTSQPLKLYFTYPSVIGKRNPYATPGSTMWTNDYILDLKAGSGFQSFDLGEKAESLAGGGIAFVDEYDHAKSVQATYTYKTGKMIDDPIRPLAQYKVAGNIVPTPPVFGRKERKIPETKTISSNQFDLTKMVGNRIVVGAQKDKAGRITALKLSNIIGGSGSF